MEELYVVGDPTPGLLFNLMLVVEVVARLYKIFVVESLELKANAIVVSIPRHLLILGDLIESNEERDWKIAYLVWL